MTVDVIILSKCEDEDSFAVNNRCIQSLIHSEQAYSFNVLLIESNPDFHTLGYSYSWPDVTVLIPAEPFHFNRFLNNGLQHAQQPWVVFCNNDLIFHPGWLSEIFNVKAQRPAIQSFCPFDRTSPYLSWQQYNNKPYHIGYRVPIEFVGWCFVTERSLFNKTGPFDETFDLYFQDNDFALTLQKHSILHAMVPSSYVKHIGGYTTQVYDASVTAKYAEDKVKFLRKWKGTYWQRVKRKMRRVFSRITRRQINTNR